MELSPATVGLMVVLALLLGAGALGVAAAALKGQRRVRSAYRTFSGAHRDDVLTLLERHIDEVSRLREEVADLRRHGADLRALIGRTVSRVGTIRYDAFDDMGGHLSFSTALLDEHGDGLVLTVINGRTETRAYAKAIERGQSRHLSAEEDFAITQAMSRGRDERDSARGSAFRTARDRRAS